MKRFLKNNIWYIISFLILLIVLGISSNNYWGELSGREERFNQIKYDCENTNKYPIEYCDDVINNYQKSDFYYSFTEVYIFGFRNITFITILFVVIPLLIKVCRYMKNGIIKNELNRKPYRKVGKCLLKESLKASLILPGILIITFIICYVFAGRLDGSRSIINNNTPWGIELLTKPYLFMLLNFARTFLMCFIYSNIAILIVRKHHNIFVAILLTVLTFFGIEIFLEVVVGGIILSTIFKSDFGIIINILSINAFNDSYGLIWPFVVLLIILIILLLINYYLYKDKEKLLIDIEGNE